MSDAFSMQRICTGCWRPLIGISCNGNPSRETPARLQISSETISWQACSLVACSKRDAVLTASPMAVKETAFENPISPTITIPR